MTSVLVSGASVAGLTLAYWLREQGYAPTVVERAPAVRPGGHAIDVRGAALTVLDRMGLLEQARAARTRMRGMTMLDGAGTEQWRSEEMTLSGGRLDGADIELLREDLTGLLYERAQGGVEYLFDDSITALHEERDGVRVEFAHAPSRTFALVVGADGLHSAVRRLAFGPEERFLRPLGPHLAVFRADNFLQLDNWQVWLQEGDAAVCVYPVRDNTEVRVTLGFTADGLRYDHRDTAQQQALLAEHLGHLGWEVPRLLRVMLQAPDFYFDSMAQVHLDHWARGRITLIGDACHCPSPLSGQGTSLALVAAYLLAAELGRAEPGSTEGEFGAALSRYEARVRPFAELNQALVTANPGGAAPEEDVERAKNAVALDG